MNTNLKTVKVNLSLLARVYEELENLLELADLHEEDAEGAMQLMLEIEPMIECPECDPGSSILECDEEDCCMRKGAGK